MCSIDDYNPILYLPWDEQISQDILKEVSLGFENLLFSHFQFDDFLDIEDENGSIVAIPPHHVVDSLVLAKSKGTKNFETLEVKAMSLTLF